MSEPPVHRLEEALGHRFSDPTLLRAALTHSSFRNERADVEYDNERLEFLGDAVVGCIVSHLLCEQFPDEPEGALTRYRAMLVSEEGLADCARRLHLGEHLHLGRGEERSGGRDKPSVLADAIESVLGALYLDAGFARTLEIVREQLAPRLVDLARDARPTDFKTRVQEVVQARMRALPRYRVVRESGPDHEKHFEVALVVREQVLSVGQGRSKKEAQQEAARLFLDALDRGEDLLGAQE